MLNAMVGEEMEWIIDERLDIPQQNNGYDCGIMALLFGLYTVQGRGDAMDFSSAHTPYFRRRFAFEILTGQLIPFESTVTSADTLIEGSQLSCNFSYFTL